MSGFVADHPGAEVRVSPNFGPRVNVAKPDMIILHYTGMKSGEAAEQRLCDPLAEVSSHYLVHEDGRIVQMVREADRAWHAGKSFWGGIVDVNSHSVGIEIVNPGEEHGYRDFPDRQMATVVELCLGIKARHDIATERVLGHSDIAPGRKIDPGERFDWALLARHGLGLYVEPEPLRGGKPLRLGASGSAVERLQSALAAYGYGLEITGQYDAQTEKVVGTFQRHFRPERFDGVADRSTITTLTKLIGARLA